jgi:glycosyltransferase involved in cell wall biosynthesis
MRSADVCLILEGTYPYVTGGVSSWTHDLLQAQKDLTFHLVTLLPRNGSLTQRYDLPKNVVGTTQIFIQELPERSCPARRADEFFHAVETPLLRLQGRGGLRDLQDIIAVLSPMRANVGAELLMNSPRAWSTLVNMYRATVPTSSFLDYFWSWRSLVGGLFSVLVPDLPDARVYHAVSTGYAGLLLARAVLETNRPGIVTEHGIYTNERRIEMALANWLHEQPSEGLHIDKPGRALHDLWVDTFVAYSHTCYQAARAIVTLYEGNQQFQLQDGAPADKLRVIPNGIDVDTYAAVPRARAPHAPTVALIGRVVPIKDVKTFLRACAILKGMLPRLEVLIVGPTDEDEAYYQECVNLVRFLNLSDTVTFTGRVRLEEFLGRIDVVVLTSISEAQPLVILEAGASGIPTVSTDVGSCRELIVGRSDEAPALGHAGEVTPLCNPSATAQALARLLTDGDWYARCSHAIKERVRRYYNKTTVDATYRELYEQHFAVEAQV